MPGRRRPTRNTCGFGAGACRYCWQYSSPSTAPVVARKPPPPSPAPQLRSPPGECHTASDSPHAAPTCGCQSSPQAAPRCASGCAYPWWRNTCTAGSGRHNNRMGRRTVQHKGKFSVTKRLKIFNQ